MVCMVVDNWFYVYCVIWYSNGNNEVNDMKGYMI